MDDLQPLLPVSQAILWSGFAVFIRVGAILAVMPAFGDQAVPARVRLAVAIMFTLVVAPAVRTDIADLPQNMMTAVAMLAPEVVTGLFFGLMLRFFIFALQIAGSIAAQSTSLSQIFGGTAGVDPQPAIGHLLVIGGTALAAMMGLHVQAAAYVIYSYDLVPFAAWVPPAMLARTGTQEVARAFGLGFSLAAPFLIASLIYNVILGVINRAMPQLMVSFVGAPALTAGGLLLLLLAAPLMLAVWIAAFGDFIATPFWAWP
jgi:flagellar biosynthesis protein FliR